LKRKRDDEDEEKAIQEQPQKKKVDESTSRVCKTCGVEKNIYEFKRTNKVRRKCYDCFKQENKERIQLQKSAKKDNVNEKPNADLVGNNSDFVENDK
jgi:hypothetical protein